MCIFDYGKVKDPEYFSEGRCEAHSDHVVYASWEEYREKKAAFTSHWMDCGSLRMRGIMDRQFRDLRPRRLIAAGGMTFVFRRASRWKDGIFRSM